MSDNIYNGKIEKFKYLNATPHDKSWGTFITTIGYQYIPAHGAYPLSPHPDGYNFSADDGRRTLKEYQLVYITRGSGWFESASCPRTKIEAGMIIMLFPGDWHAYSPDPATGWDEYWIGFSGHTIDNLVRNGFFSAKNCVFRVGVDSRITDIYLELSERVCSEEDGCQQLAAGMIHSLLGRVYYENRTHSFRDSYIIRIINQAKTIIKEDFCEYKTLEEIAASLDISYSLFRREFKRHCGISPGQYRQEQKLTKAKELLRTTNMSIAEIADKLHFECIGQFSTFFRKRMGVPPLEYRKHELYKQ